MKIFLSPDDIVEQKLTEGFTVKMKPASKLKVLAFFADHPEYMIAITTGRNPFSALVKSEGYKDFLVLLSESITEWTLEKDPTVENLEEMNPMHMFLLFGAFNTANFLGTDDANFTEEIQES